MTRPPQRAREVGPRLVVDANLVENALRFGSRIAVNEYAILRSDRAACMRGLPERLFANVRSGNVAARDNNPETMTLDRRIFLAASAALASAPALGAVVGPGDVDVAIIGAGAAGIAAARKVAAAGRRFALSRRATASAGAASPTRRTFRCAVRSRRALAAHAGHQSGGEARAARLRARCLSGAAGAEAAHRPAQCARRRDGGFSRRDRARQPRDPGCGARQEPTCPARRRCRRIWANWRPTVEFVLGPFGCGKDLDEISAMDFARSLERDVDAFCRQGLGALLAKLADELPVQLRSRSRACTRRAAVSRSTPRAAASRRAQRSSRSRPMCSLAGKIKFAPELPKRQLDALAKLSLGSYDRVALELAGNPLQLAPTISCSRRRGRAHRGAARQCLGLAALAWSMSAASSAATCRPGRGRDDRLRHRLARRPLRQRRQEGDRQDPCDAMERRAWALGAFSAAAVGGQPRPQGADGAGARSHVVCRRSGARDLWGTVGGAWESGERAAECGAAAGGAASRAEPNSRKRQLPTDAWSSGKDRAWALHEVRRAGDFDIVGALTTVTETFARVSMHGVREEILRAQLEPPACLR